jgi:hypothetical protein
MSQEGHDMMCFDAETTLGHLEVEKKGEHFVCGLLGPSGLNSEDAPKFHQK